MMNMGFLDAIGVYHLIVLPFSLFLLNFLHDVCRDGKVIIRELCG